MFLKTIGDRLRYIRGKINQADFAKTMQTSINTVSNYERNESIPNADYLVKVCDEFEINPEWLLRGNGYITKKEANERLKSIILNVEEEKLSLSPEKKAILIMLLFDELMDTSMDEKQINAKMMKLMKFVEVSK